MFFIFDNIYCASYIVQQKVFGRFAREIWGNIVLRVTLAVLAFFMMALLNDYTTNLFIVVVFPVLICFGPLFYYYTKNRTEDLDLMLRRFKELPSTMQSLYVGYVWLTFTFLPVLVILLIIVNLV